MEDKQFFQVGRGAGRDPVYEIHQVPQGDWYDSIWGLLWHEAKDGIKNLNLDKEVTENIWHQEELVTILEMGDIDDRGNKTKVISADLLDLILIYIWFLRKLLDIYGTAGVYLSYVPFVFWVSFQPLFLLSIPRLRVIETLLFVSI